MRKLAYASITLACLLAPPVSAAEVTMSFNDDEQRLFQQVLEAASGSQNVKSGGIEMARIVALFHNKLFQALTQPRPVAPPVQQPQPRD